MLLALGTPVVMVAIAEKSLTPEIVASAKKWAAARSLPLSWVLATIMVESGGNPNAGAHTAREDSLGLMQVNWNAHSAEIERLGKTKRDLYGVDFNIEFGTLVLRRAYDKALKSGVSNVALATRMIYTGRPATSAFAPTAVHWEVALSRAAQVA